MKIGYARVSTKCQSLEMQIESMKKFGVDERFIFKEHISGKSNKRPELKKALHFCNEGDAFVVYKLDRLGRSMEDLIRKLNKFRKKKVDFISLTQNIDTTTAIGKLFFYIIGAFAEFESDLISERTIDGLETVKVDGKIIGKNKIITLEQFNLLEDLLDEGISKYKIAKLMGLKSRTPIYNYLKSKLKGE